MNTYGSDPALRETSPGERGVVAAIEPEGLDIFEEPTRRGVVEGRCQQDRVVAVRSIDRPAERDAGGVGEDRPLPAELGAIGRVLARSLAPTRTLVQAAVDGDVGKIQADDPVVAADRFGGDVVEHAGFDPLVTPVAHRGVRHLVRTQPFGVLPRAAGDEPHDHDLEAVPIRSALAMTAQRVGIDSHRQQRLDRRPDGVLHIRVQCTHDGGGPSTRSMLGNSTPIISGTPHRPVDGPIPRANSLVRDPFPYPRGLLTRNEASGDSRGTSRCPRSSPRSRVTSKLSHPHAILPRSHDAMNPDRHRTSTTVGTSSARILRVLVPASK